MDYKARMFDPSLSRWIQPDSITPDITNPQSFNRYSYVRNSPLVLNDPTGHREVCGVLGESCENGGASSSDPDQGGGNDPGENGDDPEDSTYHLHSDQNLYLLGWQNFSSAWSIWSNPNATMLQRMGSGYYLGIWGSAHLLLATGVTLLAYGAIVPSAAGCTMSAGCEAEVSNTGQTFIRYMVEDELRAVHETGFLRGGNAGLTYMTTDVFETVGGATSRLSLVTPPSVGVQFQVVNNARIMGPYMADALTAPARLGGGVEFWTPDKVQVVIQSVWDLLQ